MQQLPNPLPYQYNYYVMVKTTFGWKTVSDMYPSYNSARRALWELKKKYPQARLGGTLG